MLVSEKEWTRIICINKGLWSGSHKLPFSATSGRQAALTEAGKGGKKTVLVPVTSLDELLGTEQATYIKLDVEGAELAVIKGATKQLAGRPKLFVAAYHHDRDLWELPLAMWRAQPAYKIFLRKHPYVPDWELNFLAI